jgi:predicted ATPase
MRADVAAVAAPQLIGRERELDELDRRLTTHRLITVVGPGGVGKTVLALRASEDAAARFSSGVHHIDLTRASTADAVAETIAAQLGVQSWDAALVWLTGRAALVVVDNCEHVLTAAAAAISTLLQTVRTTSVLATSRSPLELPGESVVALAPLRVPAEFDGDPSASPACQLFLDRASHAGSTIRPDDIGSIAALCRRLDGLPLAIEIAAARTRTLSLSEIASRLGAGIDVLERPRFRGPTRHRSVADTIGWSYSLLEPSAAELLDLLAVFAGPFTAHDARRVTAGAIDDDTFGLRLDELVELSLVVADTGTAHATYWLLDAVRRFALTRLETTNRRDEAFDRFADHAVALAVEALEMGVSSWDRLLPHLHASFDTLLEALRWCVDHDDRPERALTVCAVLWPVGRYAQTLEPVRQVFARWPDERTPGAAAAAVTLAYCESTDGSPRRAAEIAETHIDTVKEPSLAGAMLHRVLGHARLVLGDPGGALVAFQQGREVADALGLVEASIDLAVSEAEIEAHLGNVERALVILETARRDAAASRSTVTDAAAAAVEAWVLVTRDGTAARPAVLQALEAAREIDHHGAVIANLRSLLHVDLLDDDLPAAVAAVRAWFDAVVSWGLTSDARNLVGAAALVAHRVGHDSWRRLAATHRIMPIELLPSDPATPLFSLPDVDAEPLPRSERLFAVSTSLLAVEALLADRRSGTAEPDRPDMSDGAGPSMRLAGDVWEVRFDDRTTTVRTSKGLADIARLLSAPGREVHCLDLMGASVEQHSTGEVIDGTARRRYEHRIRELQQTVEEAEADNDYLRAERAQVELDAVVEHLTAALGRGGRTRRSGDSADRARSAVTQRVRAAIRQLAASHPELGRHLQASIRTGTYCTYRPERTTTWEITQ